MPATKTKETTYSRGLHTQAGGKAWTRGFATLKAIACEQVVAIDESVVFASGGTKVSAYDNSVVHAGTGDTVEVFGTPTIIHRNGKPNVVIGFGEPKEIAEVQDVVNRTRETENTRHRPTSATRRGGKTRCFA